MGLVLLASSMLMSCATVPETGRHQLLLTSAGDEAQMGLSEFQKLKKDTPISKNAEINAMVSRVGKRIAEVAPLPNAQWEFVVFDDAKTVNAFCLPGGKVGVYTGILPITLTESGMATVIGHEVAHAVARHGGERMSEALLIAVGGVALDQVLKDKSDTSRLLVLAAYGAGSSVGVALPHSRKQELEADHLGLIYMARAGYDPRQAVDFWKRFASYNNKEGGRQFQFLSTHPVDATRIKQLELELPHAIAEYEKKSAVPGK
jgi:predicted Zn-dependent protease